MLSYPHICQRLFNRPHFIAPDKAEIILSVLAPRIGINSVIRPDGNRTGMKRMGVMDEIELADEESSKHKLFHFHRGIAYIPVIGTLVNKLGSLDPISGMTGYDGIGTKIAAAGSDPDVRGILFDIDSFGGEAAGTFDLVDQIFGTNARNGGKPIWAMATDDSLSAGYFLMSAADHIFLPRTGRLGSIGVVALHADFSKALEQDGIDVTMIFAGDRKVDGNPFEPLPEAVQQEFQASVDRSYDLFVSTVARNRGISEGRIRDTQAAIFEGEAAVDAGLADGVASPREVFAAMVAEVNGN